MDFTENIMFVFEQKRFNFGLGLLFGIRSIWRILNTDFQVFAGIRTPKKTLFWPLEELGLSLSSLLKIKTVNYLKNKSN